MNPIEFWREIVYPALIAAGPEVAYPGVELSHRHGRQWRGACPFHQSSGTTVFSVDVETLRWQCFGGCGGGDPLTYLCEGQTPTGAAFTEAVRELAAIAGVLWPETEEATKALRKRWPKRPPRPVDVPEYPPAEQVLEFWGGGLPVDEDEGVSAWLSSRGLSPSTVASRDLARTLRPGCPCPSWAHYWKPWSRGPYRLIVPLWDSEGRLRSLHARATFPVDEGRPKAVSTSPIWRGEEKVKTSCKGLVMADSLGRQILANGEAPEWWPLGRSLRIIITEGEPDWLTWASRFGDLVEDAPAVLGIIGGGKSGSWTSALAHRLPAGSRVILRTDCDESGEIYAESITKTLRSCRVLRRRPL